ncbi:MAG: glycosyltransferase family 4 protein [Planctomycetes bacterium]|nr:glycosyltransferase family 4 protein [Planctomycetota bacterium]
MAPAPVLFCSHVAEWGGAEAVLIDLLGELDRSRFAPHLAGPSTGPLPDRARALGVPVHDWPFGASRLAKWLAIPKATRRLRQLAGQVGARVLYANSAIAGYAAVRAQGPSLPCLWHLHLVAEAWLLRRGVARAAGLVAPARACLTRLPAAVQARAHVVPNGVPERCFRATGSGLRGELGMRTDPGAELLVGILGRLDPQKGHEVLLRALATLRAPWRLVVVGGEAFAAGMPRVRGYAEQLRRLAAELGIDGRVSLLGHRTDVPELMAQLDVVVVPSVGTEAAPRAIAEAQAAGRAVVASRIGGVPELIAHGSTGWLVEPNQPAALATALQQLAEQPEQRQRLGAAARAFAERHYRMAAFAAGVEAALAATLASQARGADGTR